MSNHPSLSYLYERLHIVITIKTQTMGQRTLRWGRKTEATWCTAFASLAIVVLCPVWIITNWIAVEHFNGSLQDMLSTALTNGPISLAVHFSPRPSTAALLGYGAWIVFQAALFTWLPGPISLGQLTPAGNLLKYRTNGLLAWSVTLAIELLAAVFGIIDLAVIANHWEGLLVVANAYGALLSVFCLIKAHLSPSHPGDRKFSGRSMYGLGSCWLILARFSDFRFLCRHRVESAHWSDVGLKIIPQWQTGHHCLDFNVCIRDPCIAANALC